ncbi:amino acid permease [Janibacter alkaliphilus]|uniref:Amino acid transporter n=1 Tax=Janibacter alkaliphilus TaxID=1069963 RepID=A0A852XB05_9MICO|nr:amino acid transporter [Janibacter alkaliphilus]
MTDRTDPGRAAADLASPQGVTLKRALGLPALVLFGLAYLVPLTVFTTYGIVTEETGGRVALAYCVTTLAMVFTAFSYARMVRAYPVAGSAYTYAQKSFGGHVGFLTGWSLMLDYLFLPMLNYLVIGIYLEAQFPAVPLWVWVLLAIALVTVLNVVGITSIARASSIIIAVQAVFIVVFIALALTDLGGSGELVNPFVGDGSVTGVGPVLAGAAILCLSFLGFDAVSTMAEEATDATRDIPRAILLVTVGGGAMFVVLSSVAQLALPATSFADPDSASLDVMDAVAGSWLGDFFTAAYVAGCIGSALTSQASVTRIMFVMGRDGVLPRPLAHLAARWRTPVVAIGLVSVVSLLATVIDLGLLASVVSFGALIAFSAVNLSVIKHYAIDEGRRGGADLGRYLLMPGIGFAMSVWLWTSLSQQSLTTGLIWLAVGVVYLVWLTRGFRRPPPEMDFAEAA